MLRLLVEKLLGLWSGAGVAARLLLALCVGLLLFSASRTGYLGPELERLNRSVLATHIPGLDGQAAASIVADWQIATDGEAVPLAPGGSCPSGSIISVRYSAAANGWIHAVGLSASGPYALLEGGREAKPVRAGVIYRTDILLDDEEGVELLGLAFTPLPLGPDDPRLALRDHGAIVAEIRGAKGAAPIQIFSRLPRWAAASTLHCIHRVR